MKKLIQLLLSKSMISNSGELNVNIYVINIEAKKLFNIDYDFFKSSTDYYEIIFS